MTDRSTEPEDFDPDEVELLNKLVREVNSQNETLAPRARPSDDSIVNFITGTASKAEDQEVRAAMLQSHMFRREVLELAREYDERSTSSFTASDSAVIAGPIPAFEDFKKKHALGVSESARRTTKTNKPIGHSIRVIVPWAIAASMSLVAVSQFISKGTPQLQFVPLVLPTKVDVVSKAHFVRNTTRSVTADKLPTPDSFTISRDAAEYSFTEALQFLHGSYVLNPSAGSARIDVRTRPIQLSLRTGDLDLLGAVSLGVPILREDAMRRVEIWILGIPSRELYTSSIPSDSLSLLWAATTDTLIEVLVTYPTDSGFASTPVVSLSIEK